ADVLDRIVPPVERFLQSHTKQELFDGAVARRILLFPVATPADICSNPQLEARRYFRKVDHPDLGTPLTFLGPFVEASATPPQLPRFPPRLGQHNAQIFVEEMGLTVDDLCRLRRIGTI